MDDKQTLQSRRLRFLREAHKPPPLLPANRVAWAGGKIVTNSKEVALQKLVLRKQRAGEILTTDQMRAAAAAGLLERSSSHINIAATEQKSSVFKVDNSEHTNHGEHCCKVNGEVNKSILHLEKKLRDCKVLEEKLAAGVSLEANQKAKLARKTEWLTQKREWLAQHSSQEKDDRHEQQ